jgi:CO dehydrogenase maturation factor
MVEKVAISISGKGGTGKTTFSALLLKWIIDNTDLISLIVDADPATNLPDVLGIEIENTVGQVSKRMQTEIEVGAISPTVPKQNILEAWIFQTLVEENRFDFLAMGRSEGEGCYCYVNNILTKLLDQLTLNYPVTILDMEAGIEHLSRRTDRDVDAMIVVTDPSKMGFETAKRVKELIKEVHIDVKKTYLVGNRFPEDSLEILKQKAEEIDLELLGNIPYDDNVMNYNLTGKPLLEIPQNSSSYLAIGVIAEKLGFKRSR